MMTHEQMIKVIQAHKDGKPIEFVREVGNEWAIAPYPCWDFSIYTYRVKPEPRELELEYRGVLADGPNFNFSVISGKGLKKGEKIHVREVLE